MLNKKLTSSILGVAALGGGAVVGDSQDLLMECQQQSEVVLTGYHVCVPKEQEAEYKKFVKDPVATLKTKSKGKNTDSQYKQKMNGMKMVAELSKENKPLFQSKREFEKDGFTVNIKGSWVEGRENEETKEINYVTIFTVSAEKDGKNLKWVNKTGGTPEDTTNLMFLNQESLVPDGTKKEVEITLPDGKKQKRMEDNLKEDANLAAQYEIVEALKKSGYIE
jgi:hypothetical protein